MLANHPHFHSAKGTHLPPTRIHVRLLGPCFKTGRQVWPYTRKRIMKTPSQHHAHPAQSNIQASPFQMTPEHPDHHPHSVEPWVSHIKTRDHRITITPYNPTIADGHLDATKSQLSHPKPLLLQKPSEYKLSLNNPDRSIPLRPQTLRLSSHQRFHVLLSLSFQSAFHLSLTVLVRYRSRAPI
jgi:hypothetical protein